MPSSERHTLPSAYLQRPARSSRPPHQNQASTAAHPQPQACQAQQAWLLLLLLLWVLLWVLWRGEEAHRPAHGILPASTHRLGLNLQGASRQRRVNHHSRPVARPHAGTRQEPWEVPLWPLRRPPGAPRAPIWPQDPVSFCPATTHSRSGPQTPPGRATLPPCCRTPLT